MKVILIQDIKSHGKQWDIINVSDGYARNYLFKNKLAVEATKDNLEKLNEHKKSNEFHKEKDKEKYIDLKNQIEKTKIIIKAKIGQNGKMFGSIGAQNIVDELSKQGINVDKKSIETQPIKTLGKYVINIKLHNEVMAKLKLEVIQ